MQLFSLYTLTYLDRIIFALIFNKELKYENITVSRSGLWIMSVNKDALLKIWPFLYNLKLEVCFMIIAYFIDNPSLNI